jgi:hypothetical protein
LASRGGLSSSDRRKTVVFSTFTDTIRSVFERVSKAISNAAESDPLSDYKGRVPHPISGSMHPMAQDQREQILEGFAPDTIGTKHSPNRFDLLFTTDVLSEGVNLQQAGRIINYDLPWNPMRIVQRHGRIDRIGSNHPYVFLDCFFPAAHLDRLLNLEERLHNKLARADAAIGVGEVIPGFDGSEGRSFFDKKDQLLRLRNEDVNVLLEEGGGSALSGEEYRHRLRKATETSTLGHDVQNLPYGSGSGFVSNSIHMRGYSFCARVGSNDKPVFRFVPTDEDWNPIVALVEGEPTADIYRETLTALSAADPGSESVERHLTDDAYQGAFAAWEVAHRDISAEWGELTDPASFAPVVRKALRDAANLVGDHGAFLGQREQEDLFQRLHTVPSARVERSIREILNGGHAPREAVKQIAEIADNENLQVPLPPPKIEPVHDAEINLVCWMAVEPRNLNLDE